MSFTPRYALTLGEVSILHVGGKELGERGRRGFTNEELAQIHKKLRSKGANVEHVMISHALPEEHQSANAASVLVIHDGAALICGDAAAADKMLEEQQSIPYDKKFWNARQKKTMHKRARYNTTFAEHDVAPSEDFQTPSTHAFPPTLAAFRNGLASVLGDKAAGLSAEGNHYFEPKSGIGYHGDAERKIVICLSLGGSSVLRYHWRMPGSSEHTLSPVDIRVSHGDVYVMSEKATGFDWKYRSRVRVVHGAGSDKYIKPRKSRAATGAKRKRK